MRLRILILALVIASAPRWPSAIRWARLTPRRRKACCSSRSARRPTRLKSLRCSAVRCAEPQARRHRLGLRADAGGYIKAGPPDKVIETGEKLLAMDADDLDAAYQSLKASEAKKDPDLVRKWSDRTSQIARKLAASPQPADAEEVENWKKRVDYAKQVDVYTEYSIYAATLQSTDPRKRIELIEALNTRNPKNAHAAQMTQLQFATLRQLGDNAKALALAEKTLETDQTSEDMLAYVANDYVEKKPIPTRWSPIRTRSSS